MIIFDAGTHSIVGVHNYSMLTILFYREVQKRKEESNVFTTAL